MWEVSIVMALALIGLYHVLMGFWRWLKAFIKRPKTLREYGLIVWILFILFILALAFLMPPLFYYFVTYVGKPLERALIAWSQYWRL